eukprot:gene5088-5329_t
MQKKIESWKEEAQMKRPGQPCEVAPAYVFLASEDASYISGQTIHPNGGTVVSGYGIITHLYNGDNSRAFGRAMPLARPVQIAAPRSRTPLKVQNLRVNNVEIPNSKRVEISLQYIYGIGSTTAKAILRDTGVENKRCYELNEEEINKIREEVGKFTTEADLRRIVATNIKRLKDIGCYRGRRHIMVSGTMDGRAVQLQYLAVPLVQTTLMLTDLLLCQNKYCNTLDSLFD